MLSSWFPSLYSLSYTDLIYFIRSFCSPLDAGGFPSYKSPLRDDCIFTFFGIDVSNKLFLSNDKVSNNSSSVWVSVIKFNNCPDVIPAELYLSEISIIWSVTSFNVISSSAFTVGIVINIIPAVTIPISIFLIISFLLSFLLINI